MDSDLLFSPVIVTTLVGSISVLLVFILFRFVRLSPMGRKKKATNHPAVVCSNLNNSTADNSTPKQDPPVQTAPGSEPTSAANDDRFTSRDTAVKNEEVAFDNDANDAQGDDFQFARSKRRNRSKRDSAVEASPKESSPTEVYDHSKPESSSSSQLLEESQKRINELNSEVSRLKHLINQERSDKDDEVGTLKRKVNELERKLLTVATENAAKTDIHEKCQRMEKQISSMQVECNKVLAEKSAVEEKYKSSEKSLSDKDYELQFLRKERDDAIRRAEHLNSEFSTTLQANVKTSAEIQRELDMKEQSTKDLETKLQLLSKEIDEQREKNNTLRERNWMLMEQLNKNESPAKVPEPSGKKSKNQNKRKTSENSSNEETKALENKLKAAQETEKSLRADLKASNDNVASLNENITQLNCKINLLQKEVSILTRDKDNLEARLAKKNPGQSVNGPNIPQMEKQIAELKELNGELNKRNSQLEEALRHGGGGSSVSVVNADEINRLRSRAEESEQESRQLHMRLYNMESERSRLERVLRDTENTLSRLQLAVDEEETKWSQALDEANAENQKTRDELSKAKEEIGRLSGGSEKAQKLAELDALLAKVTEERDKALNEINQIKKSQPISPVELSSNNQAPNGSENSATPQKEPCENSAAKPKSANENKL